MTPDQFRRLAETWGGDIDRWPAGTRDAARELATTAEGGRLLLEEGRFDRLLAMAPEIDPERTERAGFAVLQKLSGAGADRRLPWYRRTLRWPALVPTVSLACSVGMGVWLAGAVPYDARTPDALAVMSGVFDVYSIGFGGIR